MNRWKIAVLVALALAPFTFAAPKKGDTRDIERIGNAGKLRKEILDIPDNILQDRIEKARCVSVLLS